MMIRNIIFAVVIAASLSACSFNYLERPRPMYMRCTMEKQEYMNSASNIFEHNGYTIVERDDEQGVLMVRDTIPEVAWRFESLVRTWRIEHQTDTIQIEVWSVSTRKDGSDVKQTWDKKWSDEIVKDWMRPVMVSLESVCGLSSPLRPSRK